MLRQQLQIGSHSHASTLFWTTALHLITLQACNKQHAHTYISGKHFFLEGWSLGWFRRRHRLIWWSQPSTLTEIWSWAVVKYYPSTNPHSIYTVLYSHPFFNNVNLWLIKIPTIMTFFFLHWLIKAPRIMSFFLEGWVFFGDFFIVIYCYFCSLAFWFFRSLDADFQWQQDIYWDFEGLWMQISFRNWRFPLRFCGFWRSVDADFL